MSALIESYIPINKGHFELDTPERSLEFSRKLASGWEKEYKEYRKLWIDLPMEKIVRNYPLLVDVELSSVCNLKCPMCPTITDKFQEKIPKKFLAFDLFKKIVDEVKGKIYSMRLSLVGEPTLHRNLVDAIKYAKIAGIPEVSFLTNGSLLNIEYFEKIAKAGADWITISIDGLNDEYEKIRKPLKFTETFSKLQDIYDYKRRNNINKPVIKVQCVWPAIRQNPSAYYNTIAPLVDLVAYNPLIDYLHKDVDIVYENNFRCPQLYQRIVVCSDGKVKLCSNDEYREVILGDIATQSVYEIWHGVLLHNFRNIHSACDGFKTINVCKNCYYPRKTEASEKAFIDGREFLVENYVNRKQTIGE